MKPPRISLSRALMLVLVIAINFGIVRAAYDARHFDVSIALVGIILPGNVFALGIDRLAARRESRRAFLLGIVAHCLVAITAFLAIALFVPGGVQPLLMAWLMPLVGGNSLYAWLGPGGWSKGAVGLASIILLLGLLQIAYAVLAGALTWLIVRMARSAGRRRAV
jgi:hypothetical protein